MIKFFLTLFLFFTTVCSTFSQEHIDNMLKELDQKIEEYIPGEQTTKVEPQEEAFMTPEEDIYMEEDSYISPAEYRIQLIRGIFFATPVLLIICLVFLKLVKGSSAHNVVNATGLILVIQATMFIVIASPSTEALTAAIGVLGAIIGYLFGANMRKTDEAKESPHTEPA